MKGGGVVDSIADIANYASALAQSQDQPLLLVRLHLGKDINLANQLLQGLIALPPDLRSGQNSASKEAHLFA